ncbi:MAG: response regulator [Pseudomonadota bacterium]|nr:response regulator [Pseudomonadota bacterium]
MTTEPKLEHPAPENAKPPEKTFRILFLDSAENIELLKETCKEVGYVVVGATTIKEAWAFLHGKDHADVIVCAAYLEDESVFEFLKGVREDEAHGDAMFVILSLEPGSFGARLDRSTKSAALALGADSYLIMPLFDPGELIAELRKLQPAVPMLRQSPTTEEKRRTW